MKNTNLSPFVNIFYGVVITSLLFIIIGLLAKFNIIATEVYNLKNLDIVGVYLFVAGSFILGVGLLIIANEEDKEENK